MMLGHPEIKLMVRDTGVGQMSVIKGRKILDQNHGRYSGMVPGFLNAAIPSQEKLNRRK
jgi:hypothetical protein